MSDGARATGYHVPLFYSEIQPMPLSPKAPASSSATLPEAGVPVPRVSVVIPLYNHEKYIEAAIQSVLLQTVKPAEIIVIDDGSTDGSAEVVRHLCKDHPEIIFWSWANQGAHHTLNAGILRATGDFVAFLNSDDCFAPDRLAACLALVQSEPLIDVVATRASFLDDEGKAVANPWYEDALAFYRQEADVAFALFRANFLVTTSNLFVRRSVFESVGTFAPLRYTHDLEFILRLVLGKRKIAFLDQALVSYRLHEKNTISENKAREDIERSAVFAYYLYRQWRSEAVHGPWRNALERYAEVLGQQDILEMVEEFLVLLMDQAAQEISAVAGALPTEFKAFLARLGVDWIAHGSAEPLLQRFSAARKVFLRREQEAADGAQLKADIQWLVEQRDAWAGTAQAREEQVKSLTRAFQEMRAGNDWLAEQRNAWEQTAHSREDQVKELSKWLEEQTKSSNQVIEETRASNTWLVEQRTAWEQTARSQEDQAKLLTQALHEMAAAKAWLLEQRNAWEQVARGQEENAKSLTQALEEMRIGNAWLLDQRDAWQQAAAKSGDELTRCQEALNGLLDKHLFRLLLRTRLLELTYIPPSDAPTV